MDKDKMRKFIEEQTQKFLSEGKGVKKLKPQKTPKVITMKNSKFPTTDETTNERPTGFGQKFSGPNEE